METWIVQLSGLAIFLLFNSIVIDIFKEPILRVFKKVWLAHVALLFGEVTLFIFIIVVFYEFV